MNNSTSKIIFFLLANYFTLFSNNDLYIEHENKEVSGKWIQSIKIFEEEGGDLLLDCGEFEVKQLSTKFRSENGDLVNAWVYEPSDRSKIDNEIAIIVAGINSHPIAYSPLAAELAARGIPTLILTFRGKGINEDLKESYGVYEVIDFMMSFFTMKKIYNLEDGFKSNIIASSLGCTVVLNGFENLNKLETQDNEKINTKIEKIVLLSPFADLENKTQALLKKKEIKRLNKILEEYESEINDFDPKSVLKFVPKDSEILTLWADEDKLVSDSDKEYFQNLLENEKINFKMEILQNANHSIIYNVAPHIKSSQDNIRIISNFILD